MDDRRDLTDLLDTMLELRASLFEAERERTDEIAAAHPRQRRSATNLVHYVALRSRDLRSLQVTLAANGLSSLGRSEAHVMATVESVIARLAASIAEPYGAASGHLSVTDGRALLAANSDHLLGPPPVGRRARIMVTLPSEAAQAPELVESFVAHGMDIARINCAHDDPPRWRAMAAHVRSAAPRGGLIAMDLSGPKVRTGPLTPGPRALKVSPHRDRLGMVIEPALVVLVGQRGDEPPDTGADAVVPVADRTWLEQREPGEATTVLDARGSMRTWTVIEAHGRWLAATCRQTAYLLTGLELTVQQADGVDVTTVGELEAYSQYHQVHHGDRVLLTRSLEPVEPTTGTVHRIGCTLPEAFDAVRPGHRVVFDDGRFGGIARSVSDENIEVEIVDIRPSGAKLRAGKGINFPDSSLEIGALTTADLADLEVVAELADIVNMSFVRRAADVAVLQNALDRLGRHDMGIIAKIENAEAFERLPEILLAGMRSPSLGVMIARGDLAVEVGFDRLAEVQEEILWICEAAHVPVVWATEVLDTMARTGRATRAEVTDAAMSVRAECVMLNKGPFVNSSLVTLDGILRRMQDHHDKKRSLLRRLRAWSD